MKACVPRGCNERRRRQQRGSALILSLFVLALLAMMGVALLTTSQFEVKMARTNVDSKKVFYLAESGLEHGRTQIAGFASLAGELTRVAGVNGQIDFDPAAVVPTYDAQGQLVSLSGYGDDTPLTAVTALGEGWYAAFLTNDAADGLNNSADSNGKALVTAVGIGPRNSLEMVQALVEVDQSVPPPPQAVITLLGETPLWSASGAGNNWNGTDCNDPSLYYPVLGATSAEAARLLDLQARLTDSTLTSGPYTGEDTVADLTDTTEPLVNAAIDPSWLDCGYLQTLLADLEAEADYVCPPDPDPLDGIPRTCDFSAATNEDVIFVEGDIQLGGDHGMGLTASAGLLVVTGTLKVWNLGDWDGTILVLGEGELIYNGLNGTDLNVTGNLIIGNMSGPDGSYGNGDDCTGPGGGLANSSYEEFNSTTDVGYCGVSVNQATGNSTAATIISFRQG